jgi:predicted AAA+ superfamily ATPase
MFYRSIISELEKWLLNPNRKPLVIRGARQVGKTTLVNYFAGRFEQYIYLNLELNEDKQPFEQFTNIETLVQTLFFLKNKVLSQKSKTLLFIDEIQEVPEAINILRYFYEQVPEIPVIAAGSMLETLLDKSVSFPVGRVEYKVLRPVSFPEFLTAIGETTVLEQLQQIPLAAFAHSKLLNLFHTYALIGGMPEVVNHYAQYKDLTALSSIYDSLITSYIDDAEKYAANTTQLQMIRHTIRASFAQAGKRIKYQGFGNSNYGSREMGEVLRTLEKALLIYLVFPDTGFTLPLLPDLKKSPRLQVLDTGLLNYFVGIQKEIIGSADLNSVYQGTMIEHLVGQELLATQYNALSSLHFWVREKKTSTAELDYVYAFNGKLIPIEVKSGPDGRLKSLHMFMEETPHDLAVRIYSGELNIQTIAQDGKKYHLLNLPYYLVSQIEKYLEWFENKVKSEK